MATEQKRSAILEAAIRRFTHDGVLHTTMNAIAADLCISKALLYYYYPDKMSLYAAVLEQVANVDTLRNQHELDVQEDPLRAIDRFLEVRTEFILKYYTLLEFLKAFAPHQMPAPLKMVIDMLRARELDRITSIIQKGRASGLFPIDNARKSAELYFDFLDCYRSCVFDMKPGSFPEKKQFNAVLRREKEFTRIFMNGLSCAH